MKNPDKDSPRAQSEAYRTFLGLLGAACGAIRLVCLDCKPFWADECFSAVMARLKWKDFVLLLWSREANMTLYYLLLRGWIHFGQSEYFLRSLSVLFAAATVPAIGWLGGQLFGRRAGFIAAALFMFNAYSVRYSQEARSYALFVLLATISSGFLIAYLRAPTVKNRAGYILVSVLAVYAHFYMLLLLAAHFLSLFWLDGLSDKARAGLRRAWVTIGICEVPLVIFIVKTRTRPILWIPRPGVRDLLEFFEHLSGGVNWLLPTAYLIAIAMACARSNAKIHRQGWEAWRTQFLLIWLLFPMLVTALLSAFLPVFLGRYLIFCLPALVILCARGVTGLPYAWLRVAAVSAILALSVQGVLFAYGHDFDQERDAAGAATNFILDHAEAGDGIILHFSLARAPYEFFRSKRAPTSRPEPEILYPRHGDALDYRDFRGVPTAALLQSAAPGHPRVWVMLMYAEENGKPDPATEMLGRVLLQAYPSLQRWEFPKVELRLYSRN